MEQPLPTPPAAPAATRAHWTPARQRLFLTVLLETGNVSYAARAAGMSRSSAHRLRQRLAGTAFDRTWANALTIHARRMADPFALETPQSQPDAHRTSGAPISPNCRVDGASLPLHSPAKCESAPNRPTTV